MQAKQAIEQIQDLVWLYTESAVEMGCHGQQFRDGGSVAGMADFEPNDSNVRAAERQTRIRAVLMSLSPPHQCALEACYTPRRVQAQMSRYGAAAALVQMWQLHAHESPERRTLARAVEATRKRKRNIKGRKYVTAPRDGQQEAHKAAVAKLDAYDAATVADALELAHEAHLAYRLAASTQRHQPGRRRARAHRFMADSRLSGRDLDRAVDAWFNDGDRSALSTDGLGTGWTAAARCE